MRLQVYMLNQDDPSKCTAAKLVKFGLVQRIQTTNRNSLILDPFSSSFVLKNDTNLVGSITAIDCSWELASMTFVKKFLGIHRRLPPLLAGNPVNYSKVGKLTTAEAISATLFIMGLTDQSLLLLDKFKWGHTFFELNENLLEEYSKAVNQDQILDISKEYGLLYSIE